jgi:hypothetical protein
MRPSDASPLRIAQHALGALTVLSMEGVLDSTTYATVRDCIIKAALDEPAAVIVDVSALDIPAGSACAVFTSARWQVSRWPDVPIVLSCTDADRRKVLTRNGIGRYVPIHADVDAAAEEVRACTKVRVRRRARVELLRAKASLGEARDFVSECLVEWSQQNMTTAAKVIATELVRNVLAHTGSNPSLRVESSDGHVTIAVDDASTQPAQLCEATAQRRITGLQLVAALSEAWGSSPSLTGKTVWATVAADV